MSIYDEGTLIIVVILLIFSILFTWCDWKNKECPLHRKAVRASQVIIFSYLLGIYVSVLLFDPIPDILKTGFLTRIGVIMLVIASILEVYTSECRTNAN